MHLNLFQVLVIMAPPVVSHTLNGLVPFTNYTFKIGACNSVGCINSSDSYGSTLQASKCSYTVKPYNKTLLYQSQNEQLILLQFIQVTSN